ncbi:unnamed protein product [Cylindrotheca closterium]|uniref:Uncharacterized protein n=1 Tax=Cylindrotheca closterium TaxID=2856 RepID=A0AAD2FH43_9STRA|nr:unnamed protein product [Cylindrotheca closterium]
MISQPKVFTLPFTDQVIQRVEAWAAAKGVTSVKFFEKKRDLETFQDGDQIAGVDDTKQGYFKEAFDQDCEPGDTLIMWASKMQTTIDLGTTEAEYLALSLFGTFVRIMFTIDLIPGLQTNLVNTCT